MFSCIKVLLKAGALISQLTPFKFSCLNNANANALQVQQVKPQLKHICRQVIRKHLVELDPHQRLFGRIPKLGLPRSLTSYLLSEMSLEMDDKDLIKSNAVHDHASDKKDGSDDYAENDDDNDSDEDDIDDDVRKIMESDQCKTQ